MVNGTNWTVVVDGGLGLREYGWTKYVFIKVFEELGFTVTGDFITSTDFDDLVLFNNYAIEDYFTILNYVDVNHTIDPRNHVPDISLVDFLKAILVKCVFSTF